MALTKAQVLAAITGTTKPFVGQHLGTNATKYAEFITALETATGQCPVMVGGDYGHAQTLAQLLTQNLLLETFWLRGGLVTIYHPANSPWTGGDASDCTGANPVDLMDPTSAAYAAWMVELAKIGDALTDLQTRGVVVLWRPFHEMQHGKNNWWDYGNLPNPANSTPFKVMWQHEYNYLITTRGLTNVLFVYAASDSGYWQNLTFMYPSNPYVDIVGIDLYSNTLRLKNTDVGYNQLLATGKPFAFTECGPLSINDGSFDNRILAASIKANYPAARYFHVWSSWAGHKKAIVDNARAIDLMTSPDVITLSEFVGADPTVAIAVSPTTPIGWWQSFTLTWITTNAVSAKIDQGVGNVVTSGCKKIMPWKRGDFKYTITATGIDGSTVQASVTVKVK